MSKNRSFLKLKFNKKNDINKVIENIIKNNIVSEKMLMEDGKCTIKKLKIKQLGKEGRQGKIYSGKIKNKKIIVKETKKKTNMEINSVKKKDKIMIYSNNFTNQTLIGFGLMKYGFDNFYNIVNNYGYLMCDGKGYNILELVNSGDIADFDSNFLTKNIKRNSKYINELIIQFTLSINHLQTVADFIHGDLKTKNVFIDSRSNKMSKYKTSVGVIKRKIKYFTLKIADLDKSSMTYKIGRTKYRFLSKKTLCNLSFYNFKIHNGKRKYFKLFNNIIFTYCATRHVDMNTEIVKSYDIVTFLTSCLGKKWFFNWSNSNGLFEEICNLIHEDDRKEYIKIIIDNLFKKNNPLNSLGILLRNIHGIRIYLDAYKYWLKVIVKKFKLKK